MSLSEWNSKQNKQYIHTLYDTTYQKFSEFLSYHPNLYAGVNLTNFEIDYINNHFWEYEVEPQTFEYEFIQLLRESVQRYNNMKAIELIDEVFEKVTDKTVRHLVKDRVDTLSRTASRETESETQTNANNKSADRKNPMMSTGTNFDNTVTWESGASNIAEDKQTSSQNITGNDLQLLTDNATGSGNDFETVEKTTMPMVDLIDKIWNYLLKPKSLEYLTSYISKAFILVY